jgi:hypothetical protein
MRAQGLNALPAPLSKKLEDLIKKLKEGRLTEGLTPIGGEKQ